MQNYERYLAEFADHFRLESINKWGQKFITFRTLMQVMHWWQKKIFYRGGL